VRVRSDLKQGGAEDGGGNENYTADEEKPPTTTKAVVHNEEDRKSVVSKGSNAVNQPQVVVGISQRGDNANP
jgi:hypothetical protein